METEEGNGKKLEDAIVMTFEDRLVAENLQLKRMNLALQEKALLETLKEIRRETGVLQGEYLALKSSLEKKYGVDLSKVEVRSTDGCIVPAGSTATGSLR